MNRYLIKFKKEGNLRFISHLDLMRVFQRAFKRADIKIEYSKGYSPHPKLSIAQPLSLGFLSTGEYFEAVLENAENCGQLLWRLNEVMPSGLLLIKCGLLDEKTKSMAALVEYAEYDIEIAFKTAIDRDYFGDRSKNYMNGEHFYVTKVQRKTGKEIQTDIKPLIDFFDIINFDGKLCRISCIIRTGSIENLNPELLIRHFMEYMGLLAEESEITVIRRELYFTEKGKLLPLQDAVLV